MAGCFTQQRYQLLPAFIVVVDHQHRRLYIGEPSAEAIAAEAPDLIVVSATGNDSAIKLVALTRAAACASWPVASPSSVTSCCQLLSS
jgi:ABC-type Fe3+-hydroxamate transport system substrate-binding protein